MKQRELDDGFADTTPLPDPPDRLNAESLKAIREGEAFMATGKPGRFHNAADLIDAALEAPEV